MNFETLLTNITNDLFRTSDSFEHFIMFSPARKMKFSIKDFFSKCDQSAGNSYKTFAQSNFFILLSVASNIGISLSLFYCNIWDKISKGRPIEIYRNLPLKKKLDMVCLAHFNRMFIFIPPENVRKFLVGGIEIEHRAKIEHTNV